MRLNKTKTMIILRQRAYAENEGMGTDKNKGMSTGKKVALGTLGTLGTAGLAFAGAKRGVFGGRMQMSANKLWARGGQMLGNQKMINSARTGYVQGMAKKAGITDKKTMVKLENDLKNLADSSSNPNYNSVFKDISPKATS